MSAGQLHIFVGLTRPGCSGIPWMTHHLQGPRESVHPPLPFSVPRTLQPFSDDRTVRNAFSCMKIPAESHDRNRSSDRWHFSHRAVKNHTASGNDRHRPAQISQSDLQHIDDTGESQDFVVHKPERYRT